MSRILSCTIFFLPVWAGVIAGETYTSDKEILDWKPPQTLQRSYPYYLSGFDHDGSPVEVGKWDFRAAIETGPEIAEDLDKWMTQMMVRWRETGNEEPGNPGAVVIADLEGFDIRQAGSIPVIQLLLKQFPKFQQVTRLPGIKRIYLINTNYLAERVYETGKPLLGSVANIIDVYGTNPIKWKPKLLKDVPADQLPSWYGGVSSHSPVQVWG